MTASKVISLAALAAACGSRTGLSVVDGSGATTGLADSSGATPGVADSSGATTGVADSSGTTTGVADSSGATTGVACVANGQAFLGCDGLPHSFAIDYSSPTQSAGCQLDGTKVGPPCQPGSPCEVVFVDANGLRGVCR